jgi:hypothetical protein
MIGTPSMMGYSPKHCRLEQTSTPSIKASWVFFEIDRISSGEIRPSVCLHRGHTGCSFSK